MLGMTVSAFAQTYPVKTVRVIAPVGVGDTGDILARLITQKVGERLGRQFVVDNRPGAAGQLGLELAARAVPDGYTIMLTAPGHAVNPSMMKLNFDPIRDFAFITIAAQSVNLLVTHPSLPAKNVKEMVALAKARPGDLNVAVGGAGSSNYVAAVLFSHMALNTGVNVSATTPDSTIDEAIVMENWR